MRTHSKAMAIAVTEVSVNDPAVAPFRAVVTRQPYAVSFARADNQKIATYFARWQNARGLTGPWSNPIAFTIVALWVARATRRCLIPSSSRRRDWGL